MENLSLQGKSNFFEKRLSEYQRLSLLGPESEREIRFDADF
jgi:ribonucleoside-diphosphate reductase subunit M2